MKRCLTLSICAVALAAFSLSSAQADILDLDLEYTAAGEWDLYAAVVNGGDNPGNGALGIAAVRAMIDNIDFGTGGDAVVFSTTIGAINPIDEGGSNERDPVLQTSGGTLDIIYGQDISDGPGGLIVGNVGIGTRELIASGTWAGGANPAPAFGADDNSLESDGNFLTCLSPLGCGEAVAADSVDAMAMLVGGPAILFGDANNDGFVAADDIGAITSNFGASEAPATGLLIGDANDDGFVAADDIGTVTSNFGASLPLSGGLASASVPEPSSVVLLSLAGIAFGGIARRR